MPEEVYYLRIKKSYAADVIEDLQKMDAIELLGEPPIPEWQKKEVRSRLEEEKSVKKTAKVQLLQGLKEAVQEVNDIKAGKLKGIDAKALLDEL